MSICLQKLHKDSSAYQPIIIWWFMNTQCIKQCRVFLRSLSHWMFQLWIIVNYSLCLRCPCFIDGGWLRVGWWDWRGQRFHSVWLWLKRLHDKWKSLKSIFSQLTLLQTVASTWATWCTSCCRFHTIPLINSLQQCCANKHSIATK